MSIKFKVELSQLYCMVSFFFFLSYDQQNLASVKRLGSLSVRSASCLIAIENWIDLSCEVLLVEFFFRLQ